ncbi:TIGR03943 family putative permease subunit [Ectobacillus sp. sgz5001026]|uniref:TIGR03943 family putative permease subunit n=1 Tax=Ectobacillus sp. sgz5001026 TaxID=3242473 RepID=UPI0036D23213
MVKRGNYFGLLFVLLIIMVFSMTEYAATHSNMNSVLSSFVPALYLIFLVYIPLLLILLSCYLIAYTRKQVTNRSNSLLDKIYGYQRFYVYMSGIALIGTGLFLFEFIGNKKETAPYIAYVLLSFCILVGSLSIIISAENKGYFHKINRFIHFLYVLASILILTLYTMYSTPFSVHPMSNEVKENDSLQFLQDAEENPQLIKERPKDFEKQVEKKLLMEKEIQVDNQNYVSIMNVIAHDVEAFVGKSITFAGFVHREDGLNEKQIGIVRYSILCCGEDETTLGLIASGANFSSLQEGDWIRVSGRIESTIVSRVLLPSVVVEKMGKIETPSSPYVYETFSK